MLNPLFSRRHVITSHYLNKNDKCSRFSLNINNLEISILQILLLKMRVNIVLQEKINRQSLQIIFSSKVVLSHLILILFKIHKEGKEDSEKVILQTLPWGHKPAAFLSPLDDNLAYWQSLALQFFRGGTWYNLLYFPAFKKI